MAYSQQCTSRRLWASESWLKASRLRIASTTGTRPVSQGPVSFIQRPAQLTTTMVILMLSYDRLPAAIPPLFHAPRPAR
ncbi:protein of unknown function [Pseudomonas sp. JV241A]|nr:protein of unknown function [Pseudomonas sp. JV241A]